jgi:hypothetical protein
MRLLLRSPLTRRTQYPRRAINPAMRNLSIPPTSEVLYALTVANSPARPSPEDVLKKSHHAQNGFRNPWEYVMLYDLLDSRSFVA